MGTTQVNRLYGGIKDSRMLEESEVMYAMLVEDLTDFTGFDADLDAGFVANLQTDIDAANNVPTDETVQDQIQQLTEVMQAKWDACKSQFQNVKYFIEKAFPKQKTVWNEFGFDDYDEMSTEQSKVAPFMTAFIAAVNKYNTELLAVNMPSNVATDATTAHDEFKVANTAQNKAIKERPTQTQARIVLYNEVWKKLQIISRASKTLYVNDYAKRQEYLLPGPYNNIQEGDEFMITGVVKNLVTGVPEEGVEVKLANVDLVSVTDSTGTFVFVDGVPTGNDSLIATKEHHKTATKNIVIEAHKKLVTNIDIEPDNT
ncbi:MAG: carboxypeptidase regulatory-like domain-containing protein [Bacteroidetes bacterium]|nr:carboxypeptidase regulatory-like domain-containing protein [Bacteroidota bacterium]